MRAARERLAAEGFSTSAREIERRLALADEMRLVLDMEHDFPGGEYPDVDYIVAKLRVEGSFLDVEEVVTLRRALAAIGGIVSFIIGREERYPALHARTRGVAAFPEIVQRIDGILDRFGNVKDNASPALQEIRRSIREREGQAAKRLQAVLSSAKGAGIVDADAQISIRDGKAVIPVSAGNKRKLNGFIHDESATGKTFYVEPVEVVEINNELRELEYAERREIVRILTEFTEAIRPDAGLIADSGDYLAEIDMLRAKGRWASENGCVRPILSTDDRLVLKNARHPLLQQTLRAAGREIVPLDLQLDRRKHILVIFQGQLDDPAQRRIPVKLPPAQIGDGQRIGIARSDLPGHLHLGGLTVPHSRTGRESDGQCSQNDKYRNSFHRFFSFALIR